MGRPITKGLKYFSKSVNFYDWDADTEIQALIEEFGPVGVTIYEVIVCMIFKKGYYLATPIDKLALAVRKIIGGRWIKTNDVVLQVISYCSGLGLFDQVLMEQSIFTSAELQRRYAEATVRSVVKIEEYNLLEKSEKSQVGESIPEIDIPDTETPVNATETPVNAAKIQQIRLDNINIPPPPLNTRTCAREIGENVENSVESFPDDETLTSEYRALFSDMCGAYGSNVVMEKLERACHDYDYTGMTALRKVSRWCREDGL